MRSVIIAEVSFFSDQNSPKNFSQKCKKILLPTLTFLIRNQGTQKSCLHKVKLTVCMLSAQYIAAMQVPFQFFTCPIIKSSLYVYHCLFSRPFFLSSSKLWWQAYGIWASTEVIQQNDKLLEDNILSYCTFVHSLQCKKNMVTFVYNFKPL